MVLSSSLSLLSLLSDTPGFHRCHMNFIISLYLLTIHMPTIFVKHLIWFLRLRKSVFSKVHCFYIQESFLFISLYGLQTKYTLWQWSDFCNRNLCRCFPSCHILFHIVEKYGGASHSSLVESLGLRGLHILVVKSWKDEVCYIKLCNIISMWNV